MQVEIEIGAYKARLDSAIKAERWDEADRVRLALKRRLLEALAAERSSEVEAISRALGESLERLTLGKRVRIRANAETAGAKLAADAETAGLGTEVRPVLGAPAANVEEAILQLLRAGNGQPMNSGELAERTEYRAETIARVLTALRAKGQVATFKAGRHRLHQAVTDTKAEGFKQKSPAFAFVQKVASPGTFKITEVTLAHSIELAVTGADLPAAQTMPTPLATKFSRSKLKNLPGQGLVDRPKPGFAFELANNALESERNLAFNSVESAALEGAELLSGKP